MKKPSVFIMFALFLSCSQKMTDPNQNLSDCWQNLPNFDLDTEMQIEMQITQHLTDDLDYYFNCSEPITVSFSYPV